MALDVLVVDDESDIRELIAGILEDEGFHARTAADADEALAELEARCPALVILDIWLQDSRLDGLQLLELMKKRYPDLPVVVISGHGNIETAVTAIKRGASDFIEKPFKADHLLHTIRRATESERLRRENAELKARAGLVVELTGSSAAITALKQAIHRIAPTNARVLIFGPPGSGKELVARLIHAHSRRNGGPFVVVPAASIEPDRMEEELFGVEGADGVERVGYLERAHGGTLFFDEIADMPLNTQAKILRVLTEQRFTRVGGRQQVSVDIRIVSATARNLEQLIREGHFREDLYHRLAVVPVVVPGLAERREDIAPLARHFLEVQARLNGRPQPRFTDAALAALQAYDWPGNVRQLKNVIERVLIFCDPRTTEIDVDMLPPEVTSRTASLFDPDHDLALMALPLKEAREAFEREYLKLQITRFSGNISRTAQFVGMERSALHRKLKALGLLPGRSRCRKPVHQAPRKVEEETGKTPSLEPSVTPA
ncbi:MAG: sigma-54-dependent Fis family transcriptional regulator [Alphaproteobacteria bacterium]|nr:MAG: sigma-54-dependent Fis family transcriptional regulator [Alphaproteobacteria bacterium]